MATQAPTSGLAAALDPRGIALIGVSNRETNLGLRFARALLRHGYGGNLAAINRRGEDVEGIPGFTDIADAPGPLDLAIVGVPVEAAVDTVEAAAEAGIRAMLMFTSGFAEVGGEGIERQRRLLEVATEREISIVGPNCAGLANVHRNAIAFASGFGFRERITPGELSVVTQSGGVAGLVCERAQDIGIGLSHIVTTGNEAQVTAAQVIEYLVEEGTTRQLAVYLEAVREPQRLANALAGATSAGVAVSVFKAGSGPQTQAAAAAHTGAVVGDDASFDALFRQVGVSRAQDLDELFLVPPIVSRMRDAGPRVCVLSTSGGAAVATADACERRGLELPPLSEETARAVAETTPGFSSTQNPIDITGTFVVDMDQFKRSLDAITSAPEFDVTVMVQTVHPEPISNRIAEVVIAGADPARLSVVWIAGDQTLPARRQLREAGFAVSESANVMATALAMAARLSGGGEALRSGVGKALADADGGGEGAAGAGAVSAPRLRAPGTGAVELDARPSRALELLGERGAPIAPMERAGSAGEAAAAAERLGFPVVIKADAADISHKTERGGVILGIADAGAARVAYERLDADGLAGDGVLVQKGLSGSRELLLTARADPVFGLVLAVGFGGVLTEAVGRAAVVLPAITPATLRAAMTDAGLGPLLGEFRGAAELDLDALSRLGNAVLDLAEDLGAVQHLELNPVIVDADGNPWAVDALVDA